MGIRVECLFIEWRDIVHNPHYFYSLTWFNTCFTQSHPPHDIQQRCSVLLNAETNPFSYLFHIYPKNGWDVSETQYSILCRIIFVNNIYLSTSFFMCPSHLISFDNSHSLKAMNLFSCRLNGWVIFIGWVLSDVKKYFISFHPHFSGEGIFIESLLYNGNMRKSITGDWKRLCQLCKV